MAYRLSYCTRIVRNEYYHDITIRLYGNVRVRDNESRRNPELQTVLLSYSKPTLAAAVYACGLSSTHRRHVAVLFYVFLLSLYKQKSHFGFLKSDMCRHMMSYHPQPI